jgi:hypothetical protein
MKKSLILSCSILLLLVSFSFAGKNQDKLKSLEKDILKMYGPNQSNSPYRFVRPGSVFKIQTALGQMRALIASGPRVNVATLPEFENYYRTVDTEPLIERFIPVAEALVTMNFQRSRDAEVALVNALNAFERAVYAMPENTPMVPESQLEGASDEIAMEDTDWDSDPEYIFPMDEDCDDMKVPTINTTASRTSSSILSEHVNPWVSAHVPGSYFSNNANARSQ